MAILHVPAPAGGPPPAIHPDWRRLEGSAVAFLDRWELYADAVQRERLARTGIGRVTALIYPYGPYELLRIGADFMAWAFAFDDEYCDEGPLSTRPGEFIRTVARMQRAVECPEASFAHEDRYARSLVDLRARLAAFAPPSHVGRFVEGVRTYLMVEMWKAVDLRPSLEDAVAMRLFSGGGWVFPVLAHVMSGSALSQDAFEDRRLRALGEMVACVCNWDNEIASFGKELARSPGRDHNLVSVIAREQGCSPQEAVSRLAGMRHRVLRLFLRLRTSVLTDAPPPVAAYVEGLARYCRGCLEWTPSNDRYSSVDGLGGDATFTAEPIDDTASPEASHAPLDIPSIAWWWRYDPAR
ncbi:hypothetical protein I5Q34_20520 [Streptomyces sp. AV19]|uniref:terpene synthase family protein n=1 Tax=Streptomyces sp. AV19 TaxID=2793068 RepID=UPI0018FEB910|nr:terpene synthase family protein [Streptomyces sp. AV19]MBH1936632.1 hypothetical protein [Streptomyces sp. AV19]MDG4532693.1 terpene synthase family protein [Streptomyces sp. AV19]